MTGAIAALRPAFQRAATLTAKGIVATANLRAALELASHPLTAPLHAAGVGGTVGIDDTCLVVSALPRVGAAQRVLNAWPSPMTLFHDSQQR